MSRKKAEAFVVFRAGRPCPKCGSTYGCSMWSDHAVPRSNVTVRCDNCMETIYSGPVQMVTAETTDEN